MISARTHTVLGLPSVSCIVAADQNEESANAGDGKAIEGLLPKLGHEVTDELVDYLNDVDAAYRADLQDLNELNFARFDAKSSSGAEASDSRRPTIS